MPAHATPSLDGSDRGAPHGLGTRVLRYAAGSVVATVCSQCAFLLVYGGLNTSAAVASVIGWLAGALPNYWLNRTWTWRRREKPSLSREVVPYVAIVLCTLLLAVLATSGVESALSGTDVSERGRVILVSATFLLVYGLVFVLRFFLMDRLFRPAGEAG